MASPKDRAIAARVLRDAGHHAEVIADLLHVSVSQVYRYLDATPSEPAPTVSQVERLQALFASQELDARGEWNASLALSLAARLDKIAVSEKAQDALAMPQIAKELRAVVREIMDVSEDDKAWLADVYSAVGNVSNPGAENPRPPDSKDR